ncbi:hypothetical protein [uncultured Shewanella sp.]|uniref:hypothetical protein n=1 Tax=uncultured Shewanella sp. TaxID=173975 RepID=UPI00260D9F32|nr:hypothetical protein [uncultured Shewanella sp.]
MSQQGSAGNVIAAIASVFIPGLGQLVQGRVLAALLFFVFIGAAYSMWVFIIPPIIGFLLHIWCIADAATFRS